MKVKNSFRFKYFGTKWVVPFKSHHNTCFGRTGRL